MATLIIHLPAEFDSKVRFRALAAQGNPEQGLKLLDKLDAVLP